MSATRITILTLAALLFSANVFSQNIKTDSLLRVLSPEMSDTSKIKIFSELATVSDNMTLSFAYLQKALQLADKINSIKWQLITLQRFCYGYRLVADYQKAINYGLKAVALAENARDTSRLFDSYFELIFTYLDLKDTKTAFEYSRKEYDLIQSGFFDGRIEKQHRLRQYYNGMARGFRILNEMDSSRHYRHLAFSIVKESKDPITIGISAVGLGTTFLTTNPDSAFFYYRIAHECLKETKRNDLLVETYAGMAKLYSNKKMYDSAMYYARLVVFVSNRSAERRLKLETSLLLQQLYAEQNKTDSAYKYLLQASVLKDSLFGPDKLAAVQLLSIKENERMEKAAQQKLEAQQRAAANLKLLILLAVLLGVSALVILLIRNNRRKHQANLLLYQQKQEIDSQKSKLEKNLENLKTTQSQLIQSEKMASLGELTAGIAHEIQNPLNFVNNFSEVNEELMAELQTEARAGNTADVLLLATTVDENLKKIIHHGRRADSIVKGMLQHSRIDGGKKELTDINALADEYLRLSYHGLRAKDKTFNSVLETHFDPSIKPVKIVPQDIGRVLLNLLNNAFYAVHEKKKTAHSNYEPTVSVSTLVNDDKISIKIKDNGNGIPKKVMDKIFQPFFTTKPTGEGTGLGLSLSYDIIKAHRGELKVDTKENEGAEFIISIPIN